MAPEVAKIALVPPPPQTRWRLLRRLRRRIFLRCDCGLEAFFDMALSFLKIAPLPNCPDCEHACAALLSNPFARSERFVFVIGAGWLGGS
jgi:hypothetical protein